MWMKSGLVVFAVVLMSGRACLVGDGGRITPDAGDLDAGAGAGRTDCPTGQCDDDSGNGKGIYVVEGGNYCIDGLWCPEAFFNMFGGGVQLELRHLSRVQELRRLPVSARVDTLDVNLMEITAREGQLLVRYREPNGTEHQVSGAELSRLRLLLTVGMSDLGLSNITITFGRVVSTATGVTEYEVFLNGKPHCAATDLAAFVPDRRVDGRTGLSTTVANVTTMACHSGAIVTCMSWGYRPWLAWPRIDEAFGSCIQAKRAAYFVSKNDYNCYTSNGTRFLFADHIDVQTARLEAIEAIWTPNGATCLSAQNRRRVAVPPLPAKPILPECPSPVPDWQGVFATAPSSTAQP